MSAQKITVNHREANTEKVDPNQQWTTKAFQNASSLGLKMDSKDLNRNSLHQNEQSNEEHMSLTFIFI